MRHVLDKAMFGPRYELAMNKLFIYVNSIRHPAKLQKGAQLAMLNAFTLILCCQLAGELMVTAAGLPIPGPVCGMALMFAGLIVRGGVPEDLGKAADVLLGNLSLLFIPAGVGVMLHLQLMSDEALPITLALVLSTLITIAVTALMMQWLGRWGRGGEGKDRGDA
jgi:holin-like protein